MKKYDLITATSMGVRITPADRQPVGIGNHYTMQATSAESNVLNVSASLGLRTRVLTAFVAGSPIASFIKGELRRRNIGYEGPEVEQGGRGAIVTSSTLQTPASACAARACTTTAPVKSAAR